MREESQRLADESFELSRSEPGLQTCYYYLSVLLLLPGTLQFTQGVSLCLSHGRNDRVS